MNPLLHTLHSEGSTYGLSGYDRWLECPRAAWLAEQARAVGEPTSDGEEALQVGTLYHALQELYRKVDGFDTTCVEYVQDSGDPAQLSEAARLEAERLFRAYRVRFKPSLLGKMLAIEEEIVVPAEVELPWKPAGLPISGRLDLVTKLAPMDVMRIRSARDINLPPGIIIWDFKTDKARYGSSSDYYTHDVKGMLYELLWAYKYPKKPLAGRAFDVVYKVKEPSFDIFYAPPVGERGERIVRARLDLVKKVLDEQRALEMPAANSKACFNWKRPCYWLSVGRCERF